MTITETELKGFADHLGDQVKQLAVNVVDISGQFLLDPNEINGWGAIGMHDNTNSQDLGNVNAANWVRTSGGFRRPYDIQLLSLEADTYNTNAAAHAWGWAMARQLKTGGSNTVSTTMIINEAIDNGGAGLRDYGNNQNQKTLIDLSANANALVPAGEIVVLGVAAPTAGTTNYYVRVMSGFISYRRVFQ